VTVLSLHDVTVTARLGTTDVDLLRRVSFELPAGRVLGLVGESGAGKSMMGRLIARLLPEGFRVSNGTMRFEGTDLLAQSPAAMQGLLGRRIAFIPQEPGAALDPVRTIGWQWRQHLARIGVPRAAHRERSVAALTEVGLRDPAGVLQRYPHQLSGGECQRVLIALAFASGPALLIADEPTTALDVTTQATIIALLRQMQAAHGTAVLFITHDLRLARTVCDDAMVLYAGDPVERGPATTLFAAPAHPYTRALLSANPQLTGPRTTLRPLPETMPGPLTFATFPGCRFASRCPVADPVCANTMPSWRAVGPAHDVTCSPLCAAGAKVDTAALLPAPPPPRTPILRVRGLGKTYPGGWGRAATVALQPIDLDVAPGEIVGIVGESGSGKSTLARLLVGLERPTAGRMELDGADITSASAANDTRRRAALQMVFQNPQSALNPRRTVGELLTQAMEVTHAPAASRYARATELLRATGLSPELASRYPFQLSGGQRQRVNIARALCITPRILLADEIVSGLDVSVQAQLLNLLLRLRDEIGIAIVLISHDLSVVRYLCDRVLVLHRGCLMESAAATDLFAHPNSDYTRTLLDACPPDPLPLASGVPA
jgi:peptide/nickel transport system ATP-binding protein